MGIKQYNFDDLCWIDFVYQGSTYSLTHLAPRTVKYVQSAQGSNPERVYEVLVGFSSHTFTADRVGHEGVDPLLHFDDGASIRVFDFHRYELSKTHLIGIVEQLYRKKCKFTQHGNFFVAEVVDSNGQKIDYAVYFTVWRSQRDLRLVIQSAYPADHRHYQNAQKPKGVISFFTLLHNVLTKKPIKAPK